MKAGVVCRSDFKVTGTLPGGSIIVRDTTNEKWQQISRNERFLTVNERHYFAGRCNPRCKWFIEEIDRAEINGSRVIRTVAEKLTTREVTKYFKPER